MKNTYYRLGKRCIADDGDRVICVINDPKPSIYSTSSEIFWRYNRIGSHDYRLVNSDVFKHAVINLNDFLRSVLNE